MGTSDSYTALFYQTLFSSFFTDKNFGKIVAETKAGKITQSLKYKTALWVQYGLNPIGDPEMPVFTTYPESFNGLVIQVNDDNISLNTGVPGCKVCVMSDYDLGETYYNVIRNVQSTQIWDLPLSYNLCITKQNHIPKEYSVCNIQDSLITTSAEYSYDCVRIGSIVSANHQSGEVVFKSGKTIIEAPSVIIEGHTLIEEGAEVIIE